MKSLHAHWCNFWVIGYSHFNFAIYCQISYSKAVCFTLKSAIPDCFHFLIYLSIFDIIFLSYFTILMDKKWYCIATIFSLLIINLFIYFLHDLFKVLPFTDYLCISFEYFSICFPVSLSLFFAVDLQEFLKYSTYSSLNCYRCSKYILPVCPLSTD